MHRILCTVPLMCLVQGCADALPTVVTAPLPSIQMVAGYTDPTKLPLAGTIAYAGEAELNAPDLSAVGVLELNADFANDRVSGSISAFKDEIGQLQGKLELALGSICRCANPNSEYTFDASISGTLSDMTRAFVVDGTLVGDFFGPDAKAVAGKLFGQITGSVGSTALSGTFLAFR